LTIDRKRFGSLLYDYEIVSGSTYATDQQTQQNNLSQLLTMLISQPQVMQSLSQEVYNFKIGEMFKRMLVNSGLNDWNKILEIQKPEEVDENVFNQDKLQFLSAVQQMQGIGQIPEQPDQSQQLPVQSPDAI
jgi:2-iminoacetate synthase ThiH